MNLQTYIKILIVFGVATSCSDEPTTSNEREPSSAAVAIYPTKPAKLVDVSKSGNTTQPEPERQFVVESLGFGQQFMIAGTDTLDIDARELKMSSTSANARTSLTARFECYTPLVGNRCVTQAVDRLRAGLAVQSVPMDQDQCTVLAAAGNYGTELPEQVGSTIRNGGVEFTFKDIELPTKQERSKSFVLAILAADGACKYFQVRLTTN